MQNVAKLISRASKTLLFITPVDFRDEENWSQTSKATIEKLHRGRLVMQKI